MIAIQNLTIRAGSRALVDGITATLPPGRLTVAVGPNGAGKSTLLRAMCGDLPFSSGDVLLEELSIRAWPQKKLALRRAVMPQKCTLNFPFTAREVAALGRIPREQWCSRGHNEAVIMKSMELAGVAHLAQRIYTSLSGGEQQRVQLARALAQILDAGAGEPRYLWLDEPTSGLDLAHQHHLMRIARELANNGASVFCILHDLNLTASYADHVLLLNQGRLVAAGPPDETLRPEIVRTVFNIDLVQAQHPQFRTPLLFAVPHSMSPGSCTMARLS